MMAAILAAQLALAQASAHDGDTLNVDRISYRLAGVDAPEVGRRAACPAESAAGEAARARVAAMLAQGRRVEAFPAPGNRGQRWLDEEGFGRDRYQRRIAVVRIDGRDLGAALIAEGLAVRWTGRKHDWCRR